MRSALLLPLLIVLASLAACGDESGAEPVGAPLSTSLVAGVEEPPRYVVTYLETHGEGASRGSGISNGGLVAGYTHHADAGVRRATLWKDGVAVDLGALGQEDSNSTVAWAGVNSIGMVVGITETGELDELGQPWSCRGFFPLGTPGGRRCVGFVWEDGVMRELPALGGSNSYATGVNNRGQVVGWAETDVLDPTCRDGQVRQFRAVVWEPRKATVRQLPPLPGDSASAATAISESGLVAGISGECDQAVGRATARHAVVWEGGTPRSCDRAHRSLHRHAGHGARLLIGQMNSAPRQPAGT